MSEPLRVFAVLLFTTFIFYFAKARFIEEDEATVVGSILNPVPDTTIFHQDIESAPLDELAGFGSGGNLNHKQIQRLAKSKDKEHD